MVDPIREHLREALRLAAAEAAGGGDPTTLPLSRAKPEREDDSLSPGAQLRRMLQRLGHEVRKVRGVNIRHNDILPGVMDLIIETQQKRTTRSFQWNKHTGQCRITGYSSFTSIDPVIAVMLADIPPEDLDEVFMERPEDVLAYVTALIGQYTASPFRLPQDPEE